MKVKIILKGGYDCYVAINEPAPLGITKQGQIVEVPDTTAEFFQLLKDECRFQVVPPGEPVGSTGKTHDITVLYFEDTYD